MYVKFEIGGRSETYCCDHAEITEIPPDSPAAKLGAEVGTSIQMVRITSMMIERPSGSNAQRAETRPLDIKSKTLRIPGDSDAAYLMDHRRRTHKIIRAPKEAAA